jgi:hypothetical protein
MSIENQGGVGPPEDELMRLWQSQRHATGDAERAARDMMSRVWRFDQVILWRNFREYAAGLVLMVVFAGQFAVGRDRIGATIGSVSVGFVMAYLWWRHRGLQPLDPAADLAAYRRALVRRFDDQIQLLRTTPFWYLLPLFLPGLWLAVSGWSHSRWMVLLPLVVFVAIFAFIGWLNVGPAVRGLQRARAQILGVEAAEE